MSTVLHEACASLLAGRALGPELAARAMRAILQGEATPAQIGAFLLGYELRGPRADEVAALVRVMRESARRIEAPPEAIDLCGTGGDGLGTFNISTTAAFIAAAAGAVVAKHGNRAASSRSGSADLLEALGLPIALEPEDASAALVRDGLAFLFAPSYHPAMRHASGPRRELGLRTVFNLLGPLANPAGTRRQLVGIFDARLARLAAQTLQALGSEHVLVVCGADGMDEITLCGPTAVCELRDDELREYTIEPAHFGLECVPPAALGGGAPEENAALTEAILRGDEQGPRADVACLNAGAALHVAGRAASIEDGLALARAAIADGRAVALLERLRG